MLTGNRANYAKIQRERRLHCLRVGEDEPLSRSEQIVRAPITMQWVFGFVRGGVDAKCASHKHRTIPERKSSPTRRVQGRR